MTASELASSNALLAAVPSVVQALMIVVLVGALTAREILRLQPRAPRAAVQLDVVVRVLGPVVVLLLGLRLLVILQ